MDDNTMTHDGALTFSQPYDPNAQLLTICASPPGEGQQPVITFFADGRIQVGDYAKPSDAARQVLAALAEMLPRHIRRPDAEPNPTWQSDH